MSHSMRHSVVEDRFVSVEVDEYGFQRRISIIVIMHSLTAENISVSNVSDRYGCFISTYAFLSAEQAITT